MVFFVIRALACCGLLLAWVASPWSVVTLPVQLVNGEGERKHLPATVPGGVAVFDADNDGRLDLFFANGGELPSGRKTSGAHANRLLRNLGGMRFADITERAGLGGEAYSFGAAAADYDQDGHTDLAVTGLRGVTLYRNRGDGTFADVTTAARLGEQGRWSVAAIWLDIENDGDLDLFVVNYVRWEAATERECLVANRPDFCHPRFYDAVPNTLYRNNGGGTFTDVSAAAGIAAHPGKGMSAATADFDGDRLTDLFVTNDRAFAFLFRNRGGGRFEEVAFDRGVAVPDDGKPVSGMGVDAQDFDNDGRPDLVYSALRDETFPLYRNTGQEFTESTAASRLGPLSRSMSGWGILFADLDNDGWKDLAAACSDALSPTGGRGAAAMERPAWFRNLGDGRFAAGEGWDALPPAMWRGAVAADLDDDGCLDLVFTALNAEARILRNPCAGGRHWLKVKAVKPGTRVRVGNQWRHATTAVGYASSYAGPLHFGLGATRTVTVEATSVTGRTVRVETAADRTVTLDP